MVLLTLKRTIATAASNAHGNYRRFCLLPKQVKAILVLCLCLSAYLYYSFFVFLWTNHLTDITFLEKEKCPACYGFTYCLALQLGKVRFTGWSRFRFLDFVNVKNVYTGQYDEKKWILKKLGHDRELKKLDMQICDMAQRQSDCDVSNAISHTPPALNTDYRIGLGSLEGMVNLNECPSQRLIDRMMDNYKERKLADDFTAEEKLYFITTLMMNPEPLILQAFPKGEGWPFPQYLGACGRFIIEEDIGESLASHYHSSWAVRVDQAYQLMQMADLFTNNDLGFALYWTDVSYENFAVDQNGKVILVDLENIIIVDKAKIKREKPPGWDAKVVSSFDDCQNYGTCLSFSPETLCSHTDADHNYYTVCRNLLSSYASDKNKPGGLLHDMPGFARNKYQLRHLLEQCAKPSKQEDRWAIKDLLIQRLDLVRKVDD